MGSLESSGHVGPCCGDAKEERWLEDSGKGFDSGKKKEKRSTACERDECRCGKKASRGAVHHIAVWAQEDSSGETCSE